MLFRLLERETLRMPTRKTDRTGVRRSARPPGIDTIIQDVGISGVLLDAAGVIVEVSADWKAFATSGDLRLVHHGIGANYLDHCRAPGAIEILRGLTQVLAGQLDLFTALYDCPTPDGLQWFLLIAAPMQGSPRRFAVLHVNLTQFLLGKLAPSVSLVGIGVPSLNRIEDLIVRTVRRSIGEAARAAQGGRQPASGEVSPRDQKLLAQLTPSEMQVLGHLATGASNAEIAALRGNTLHTAKAQVAALTRKLGLQNRTQCALFAMRNRITPG